MLVLLFVNHADACSEPALHLRDALGTGTTAIWLDAVSVTAGRENDPALQVVGVIARTIGAAIDALEPASWQSAIVTLPASLDSHAPALAFWLRRKAFTPCYVAYAPDSGAPDWARALARSIADGTARTVVPEGPAPPRIETPRLLLTIPTEAQSHHYFNAIIGTEMFDTLVWEGPRTVAELAEFAMRCARDHARQSDCWLSYGIVDRATGEWIGTAGSRSGDRDPGRYTLGYNLAVHAHGKGYGTEAVGALVQHLFQERHASRVDADVFVGNDASARLLEKLGFTREATLKSLYPKRGGRRDAWVTLNFVPPGQNETGRNR